MHWPKWILGAAWLPSGFWQGSIWPTAILSWHHCDIKNGRNKDLLGGYSNSESLWEGGDSDRENFCSLCINLGVPTGFTIKGALDLNEPRMLYLYDTYVEEIIRFIKTNIIPKYKACTIWLVTFQSNGELFDTIQFQISDLEFCPYKSRIRVSYQLIKSYF